MVNNSHPADAQWWRGVLDTTVCDKVCRWFSPGTPEISSTNKTYRHNIAEILLKVELSTLTLTLTFNNSPNHDQQNFSNSLNTKKGGDHDLWSWKYRNQIVNIKWSCKMDWNIILMQLMQYNTFSFSFLFWFYFCLVIFFWGGGKHLPPIQQLLFVIGYAVSKGHSGNEPSYWLLETQHVNENNMIDERE